MYVVCLIEDSCYSTFSCSGLPSSHDEARAQQSGDENVSILLRVDAGSGKKIRQIIWCLIYTVAYTCGPWFLYQHLYAFMVYLCMFGQLANLSNPCLGHGCAKEKGCQEHGLKSRNRSGFEVSNQLVLKAPNRTSTNKVVSNSNMAQED